MAVALTISETYEGAAVTDALANGGTGIDLGSVVNGQYSRVTNQAANEDAGSAFFIRHDAVDDPITDVKTFIQQYGNGTAFAYGGADTAANDIATLINEGNLSGSSKNNGDGLSSGLWIDMDFDATTTNQFDQANFPSVVKIYGDNNTDGIDLDSAFDMEPAAMIQASGVAASAPALGTIGKSDDTVLGDSAHIKLRAYLRTAFPDGGIVQWEWVVAYSFTS